MAARIPISWIVLLVLLSVFVFFGYQIMQASTSPANVLSVEPIKNLLDGPIKQFMDGSEDTYQTHLATLQNSLQKFAPRDQAQTTETQKPSLEIKDEPMEEHAPVIPSQPAVPNKMPSVPAQTEQDLRALKQHMETPPPVKYESPEAIDPLQRTVHMNAEFGSNLRHPEQMIEMRPAVTMKRVVASGLASEHSSPGGHTSVAYNPEMIQNGGEFMDGISAFDTSDMGTGYALI